MSPLVITIAAFVGVTALVGGIAFLLRGSSDNALDERLNQFTGENGSRQKVTSLLRDGALAESLEGGKGFFEELLSRIGKLSLLFDQADTSLTASKFVFISAVMAGAGAVAVIISGLPVVTAVIAAPLAGALPLVWLLHRRRRRFKVFASQLPDALELISRALRAGHSLGAGFQLVSTECNDPIAKEFGRVFEEQNLGIPLAEALDSVSQRIPNLDLKFFCTAVILQKQTGGDLAEILDKIGRLTRERFKIWGQIQALTGEGRLSGMVLLALPPLLFFTVYRLNPDYVMMLFEDPLGIKMLVGAVVLQLIGALVIRKIVNIKV